MCTTVQVSWTLNFNAWRRPWTLNFDARRRPWTLNFDAHRRPWTLNFDARRRPWTLNFDARRRPWTLNFDARRRPWTLNFDAHRRPWTLLFLKWTTLHYFGVLVFNIDARRRPWSLRLNWTEVLELSTESWSSAPGGVNLWQIFVDPTPRSKIQKIRFSFTKIYFWYQNRILNTSRWSRRVGDVFSIDRIRFGVRKWRFFRFSRRGVR